MDFTAREIKTGIFVLLSLAILFVGLWLAQSRGAALGEKKQYTVRFRNLGLLRQRTQVAFAGVAAGHVDEIRKLDPLKSEEGWVGEAVIAIDARIEVRSGSRAVIKTEGLIGEKYLDIIPGGGEILPEGSLLIGAVGGMGGVLDEAGDLMDDLKVALTKVVDLADDLKKTTENLPPLLEKTEGIVDENRENLKGTLAEARDSLDRLNTILEENRQSLREVIDGIGDRVDEAGPVITKADALVVRATEGLDDALKEIEDLVRRSRGAIQDADGLIVSADPKVQQTLEHLRVTTRHLEEMTRRLKADPSVLIWGAEEEEKAAAVPLPTSEDRPWMGPQEEEP